MQWRWIYWDNLPLSAIAVVIVLWSMKGHSEVKINERIDYGGVIFLSSSLFAFMFVLTKGDNFGWTSMVTLLILSLAIALFIVFLIIEIYHPEPLVDLSLFRKRDLLGGNLVNLLCNFTFSAVLYFMALYMQKIMDFTPFKTGLLLLPLTLLIIIVTPLGAGFHTMLAYVGLLSLVWHL